MCEKYTQSQGFGIIGPGRAGWGCHVEGEGLGEPRTRIMHVCTDFFVCVCVCVVCVCVLREQKLTWASITKRGPNETPGASPRQPDSFRTVERDELGFSV